MSDNRNFLFETMEFLMKHKKHENDIKWIGSKDGKYSMTWKEFVKLSNFEYDHGYGGSEIPLDLVIVGEDWWMSRGEYDGAEWWELNTKPILKSRHKKIRKLHDASEYYTSIAGYHKK